MADAQLRKLLLLALSTDNGNEAAVAISMVKAALRRDGHDIHWLADRIDGGGGRSNGHDNGTIFRAGEAQGYERGLREGLASTRSQSNGHDAGGWSPDDEGDPTVFIGPDPEPGTKMPPQRWAAWLLTRRQDRLSDWENNFARSVAQWRGTPTDRQKAKLESIILKVR